LEDHKSFVPRTLSETKRKRLEGNFNGDSDNENTTTDFKSVDSIIRHIDTSCQTDAGLHLVATFLIRSTRDISTSNGATHADLSFVPRTLSETKRKRLEGNFNGDSDNENTTTDFKSVDSIIRHIDTSCQTDAGLHLVATFLIRSTRDISTSNGATHGTSSG
ncbi:hypothetical protein DPMN_114217, partial [Dreissena polymorpha]